MVNPQLSGLPAFLVAEPGLQLRLYDPARRRGSARERDQSDVLSSLGRFSSYFGEPGRLCVDGDGCGPAAFSPCSRIFGTCWPSSSWRPARGSNFSLLLRTGSHAQKAQKLVRSVSKPVEKDRSLSADIAAVSQLIAEGEFQQILRRAFEAGARSAGESNGGATRPY